MTSAMRARLFFVTLLVAAVGGGAWYYSVQRGAAAPTPGQGQTQAQGARASKAVPVSVAPVVQRPAPVEISTVGRVQTLSAVAVRSRIDGVIANVSVADGQEVKAGDELFRIDDREAQAAVKLAEANLGKDQAQLTNAKRELDRLTPLAAKNYTTRADYDTAVTNVATLQASIAAD
ncbi:MAG TPA: biotin/lipoyl-binding protein, partial [Candidatus Binatia bacterium]|nr:biotin/lipoyl-binding protein [Candidatus Binatia bacterium]